MPTHEALLLDTHALLWWQADARRLSAGAAAAIASTTRIAVSPISFWEVAMLERKRRVALDRPIRDWCIAIGRDERIDVVPISPAIAAVAGSDADLHGDPADRLICATAVERRMPLVTKDGHITEWAASTGRAEIVW